MPLPMRQNRLTTIVPSLLAMLTFGFASLHAADSEGSGWMSQASQVTGVSEQADGSLAFGNATITGMTADGALMVSLGSAGVGVVRADLARNHSDLPDVLTALVSKIDATAPKRQKAVHTTSNPLLCWAGTYAMTSR